MDPCCRGGGRVNAARFMRLASLGLSMLLAAPAATGAQLKIGIAGPMSGANAVFGTQLRNGTALAAADANKAGGLLGQKIELVVGDDLGDPRQGVAVANTFAAGGVSFVVGHFNSATSIPASLVYFEHGVLMITPSAITPQVTEQGRWNVFRTCGRDDRQMEVAGEYIVSHFKDQKVAFLHDGTSYGRELAEGVRKYVNARGINEVLADAIEAGAADYGAEIGKIQAAGAKLLFFGGAQREAGILIRQMHDVDMDTVLMGGDAIVGDELAAVAGPAVVGTLMTFPPDERKRPEAVAVVARMRAQNGGVDDYGLYSYAAVQVLQQAVQQAGSVEPRKVAAAMHSGGPFPTVIGDIAFDNKGDVTRPDYRVYVWKKDPDGTLRYAEQAP